MTRFRLAVVERLRGQALSERANELHAVTGVLQSMTVERDQLMRQLAAGIPTGTTASGADLEMVVTYREILREQIFDVSERIDEQQVEVATAREAWMRARGELRAVQALHDRHRAAVRREQARREQRELDELAGRHGHVDTAAEHLDDSDPAFHPLDDRPSRTDGPAGPPELTVPAEVGPR